MKRSFYLVLTLALLFIGCSQQDNDVRDVQREESFGEDDFRESDNYKRTIPIEPDAKSAQ
jgi:PBP1b-binding outer membrane lipoprotein LpoB